MKANTCPDCGWPYNGHASAKQIAEFEEFGKVKTFDNQKAKSEKYRTLTQIDVGESSPDEIKKAAEKESDFTEEAIKRLRESEKADRDRQASDSAYQIRLKLIEIAIKLAEDKYHKGYTVWYNEGNPRSLEFEDTRVDDALKNAKRLYEFVKTR
jgi:hypothetical protein